MTEHKAVASDKPPLVDRVKSLGGGLAIAIWASALTLVIGTLMVSHWVVLPSPAVGQTLPAAEVTRTVSTRGRLQVFHFLSSECPCSRRVLRHLVDRGANAKVLETIVLVGESKELEMAAVKHGYVMDVVTPEELASRYEVESGPLMIVTAPDSTILYSGGYTSRKQGYEIQDERIISELLAGDEVECLPVFGCAVSKDLQAIVDPLGLKYSAR